MSQIQKLQGIVIKKIDYKENANLITLLTPKGKLSLIVRGSKKINSVTRNYTNLFSQLDFNATDNLKLNTLTEGYIVNAFVNINTDFNKMNVGLQILEKINLLCDEIQNYEVFYTFVVKVFNLLENTSYPISILNIFEIKLLYLLGVAPELRECVICQNKDIEHGFFSVSSGGIICRKHQINNYDLDSLSTNALKLLYYIKIDKIDEDFLKLINDYSITISNVIDKFYERHLDFHSKTKKIIKTIFK